MRFVFDLDGIICELKESGTKYKDVKPKKNVINLIQKLKKEGHEIIIYTSRNMLTTRGNIGKVLKNVGKDTLDWLEKYNIPFDEIYFGKPFGDVYIDDMALGYNESILEEMVDKKFINIVIPMAGDGRRFLEKGYKKPKYMLRVNGKTLLQWSLESLPLDIAKRVVFIIRKDHNEKFSAEKFIRKTIEEQFPSIKEKSKIIVIDGRTEGQAETVLKAKELINEDRILLIYNIDSYFKSTRLKQHLLTLRERGIDGGLIGVFRDTDSRWSFVRLENGYVAETREKIPISDLASTGLYVFSSGKDFVEYQKKRIVEGKKEKGEYYVIPLYNDLIRDRRKVIIDLCDKFICLGTPEDIERFGGKIDEDDNT